jgi:molybdopterin-guanine dinucleotide biosynthesis protein A
MGSGYDAIVLAGGTSRRLDSVDKADLDIGGTTLLERAVDSVASSERLVVVANRRPFARSVLWAREEPAGAGPVAATAAGMSQVRAPVVVVIACDMPMFSADTVRRLRTRLGTAGPEVDAAMLVDENGRRQLLAAAYDRAALAEALNALGDVRNQSMRALVELLKIVEVASLGAETLDCDTWDDVKRSQAMLRPRH